MPESSQCTYRCVVLPDLGVMFTIIFLYSSQCTYRCVVLPDMKLETDDKIVELMSQCTYRCVVLPDRL